MAPSAVFPGSTNVFIPSTNADADGRLIVGFSRNIAKFGLPNYVQMVPVGAPLGYYMKITVQEAVRVVNTQDFSWPDGQERPQRNRDTESFTFVPFMPQRYAYGFNLGTKTVQHATWPIKEAHAGIKASQCMTNRTVRMWQILTAPGTWMAAGDPNGDLTADHYSATGTALAGGPLYNGTSVNPLLKKAMNNIAIQITLDTASAVTGQPDEIAFVMNPVSAARLSISPEIHDFVKGSAFSPELVRQGWTGAKYGLPPTYNGYKLVVEESSRVPTRVGDTLVRKFVVPDNALVALSRVGGLEGVYGAPSFSTATIFHLEEMSIETKDDQWNRMVEGAVTEDVWEALTCPASGWYVADMSA